MDDLFIDESAEQETDSQGEAQETSSTLDASEMEELRSTIKEQQQSIAEMRGMLAVTQYRAPEKKQEEELPSLSEFLDYNDLGASIEKAVVEQSRRDKKSRESSREQRRLTRIQERENAQIEDLNDEFEDAGQMLKLFESHAAKDPALLAKARLRTNAPKWAYKWAKRQSEKQTKESELERVMRENEELKARLSGNPIPKKTKERRSNAQGPGRGATTAPGTELDEDNVFDVLD